MPVESLFRTLKSSILVLLARSYLESVILWSQQRMEKNPNTSPSPEGDLTSGAERERMLRERYILDRVISETLIQRLPVSCAIMVSQQLLSLWLLAGFEAGVAGARASGWGWWLDERLALKRDSGVSVGLAGNGVLLQSKKWFMASKCMTHTVHELFGLG